MHSVNQLRLIGAVVSILSAGSVIAQDRVPTLPASFVVYYYLVERSIASSSPPPLVLLCSDRLTPGALARMDSMFYVRGIRQVEECRPPSDSGAVLLIHRFDLQPEARIGELQATRFGPGRQSIRIEETYRTEDFSIQELRFTLSSIAPLLSSRDREMSADIELLDAHRLAREYLMPERPWLIVCDRSVSVEALNTYVLQRLPMRRTHAMLHDPECQVPAAVQSDTGQVALMIDRINLNADGSREVQARRISARRAGPLNRWDERFTLRSDGSAEFVLNGFRLVPPHE